MKGIILAGGYGTRLSPITNVISKQLIPIYDKPMIYYPLSTLMLAGIKDILLICNPKDLDSFQNILLNGNQWGINIDYKIQIKPDGLAQAFILGEEFLSNSPCALILGDNLFHGNDLSKRLQRLTFSKKGATILAYRVNDPERYGVVEFDDKLKVLNIEEKPHKPKSNFAVTGMYFYDSTVVERAKMIKPSLRGELEITDLNKLYLEDELLWIEELGRGMTWLDTGTFDSLCEASHYVQTIEKRQGLKIGCPEEISWRMGWIDDEQIIKLSKNFLKTDYGKYLQGLLI